MTADKGRNQEARHYFRFPFRGVVQLKDREGKKLRACDLSVGGIGILSDTRIGIGQTIEVVLLDGSVRVEGVVRYEVQTEGLGWRIGVQFFRPQPELIAVAIALHAK